MNNYYFTADKWYGPLPENYLVKRLNLAALIKHVPPPSGPIAPELSKWAGQVKEEGKDFVFEFEVKDHLNGWRKTNYEHYILVQHWNRRKTAVPVAEEGKQTFSEEQSELEYLRRWKKEAMYVMPDFKAIGKEIGAGLGESVHDKILPFIIKLKKENEKLKTEYLKTKQ